MIALAIALCAGAGVASICSVWIWPTSATVGINLAGIRELLQRAQLPNTSVTGFVTMSLLSGLISAGLGLALTGLGIIGLLIGLIGLIAPTLILRQRVHRRAQQLRAIWPDLIDQLVAAVRSGMGLPDALASLAQTGPEAVRPGFAAFTTTYRATGSFRTASRAAKDVLADPAADRLLATLEMANQVGGTQLVPILRTFGAHLREAQNVRHEVEARQGWVVNAARLGVVAPWIVLLLLTTRPEAATAYNTPTGSAVIIGGAIVTVVAYRLMLQLGKLPEEGRWFA